MGYIISGIQQVGVGCKDVYETWKWYRHVLGADVPVFDEKATAKLMLPYTNGQPRERHAILALNMQGGGGFEIWQHTQHDSKYPAVEPQLGDTGIFAIKIKCYNADKTFARFQQDSRVNVLSSEVEKSPDAVERFFWIKDPYNNLLQIVEAKNWFQNQGKLTGGIYGVILGTTNIVKSTALFKDVLGYDELVYDKQVEVFNDFKAIPSGNTPCTRVLLRHSQPRLGAFAPLLGATEIELIQTFDRLPKKIFENRMWGECGFIHLCFDINGMDDLKNRLATEGYPFTVDTANSFDMGEAAGRFSYIEDQDGTLIEFVETHKVPILKKIGWYLNLTNRRPEKALPRWMLKALGLNRVTD
jgi:catechol 2,3-dioxygenase-like lactoylglutathione lyase family enzyme